MIDTFRTKGELMRLFLRDRPPQKNCNPHLADLPTEDGHLGLSDGQKIEVEESGHLSR